jgi:CheY-like chemotaxis protein
VAEDDPVHREMLQEVLTGAGFDVVVAHDGASALEALRRRNPLALILDLLMPNQDGFAVLNALRSDERLRDLPVLVLTAKEMSDEDHQLLRQRGSEVLRKPGGSGVSVADALLRIIKSRPGPATLAAACALKQRDDRPRARAG